MPHFHLLKFKLSDQEIMDNYQRLRELIRKLENFT